MHTPASSAAPSPTFQSLSSQQPSSTPPISHNVPTSISSSPPSLRDTTSATNTRSADQTQPSIPSTPSSAAEQHSASPTPSMAGTYTVASSAASQPSLLPSNGPTTDVRQAVDGTDAPIDLRGLSTLPSGHALPVSTAMLGAPRTINLPTLKNPQGELLDLNELAGFGDGLSECCFYIVMIHAGTTSTAIRFMARAFWAFKLILFAASLFDKRRRVLRAYNHEWGLINL